MTTKTRKLANIGNDVLETISGGPLSGFRNAIINGNFDIWQRGTSLGSGSGLRYLADRWFNSSYGTTYTTSQQPFTLGQTVVPGEPSYFHRTVSSSVVGAQSHCVFQQRIEGVRTFSGQNMTLSFWAKADATKFIAIEIVQAVGTGGSPSSNTVTYVAKPTLTTSWSKYTYTINVPSLSGKTLGTNRDDHLEIVFWFDAGSDYSSRTNSLGQQSGTFDIAQVQVEPGSIATPFERRSLGMELELCQRYYEKSYSQGTNPGTTAPSAYNGMISRFYDSMSSAGHVGLIPFRFAVPKRVSPNMSFYSAETGAINTIYDQATLRDYAITAYQVGMNGGRVWIIQTVASTYVNLYGHYTADAEI